MNQELQVAIPPISYPSDLDRITRMMIAVMDTPEIEREENFKLTMEVVK